MNIWFDFHAAPDPFFFRPIIKEMERFGHNIFITSRDYGETVAAAKHCGYKFKVVGTHGGCSLLRRAVSTSKRVYSLTRLMNMMDVDLALSFNSYAQAITCKLCNIKFITFMDYEYHPLNLVAFRLADKVVVPSDYDQAILLKQVGNKEKISYFLGLKENISILGFVPDVTFPEKLGDLGILRDDIVITMRPPPNFSSYHPFDNELFDELVSHLAQSDRVKIVYLPRTASQAEKIRSCHFGNLIIPPLFLDGWQLSYFSDMVISAGGSMNREAVVLGTPAYTLFKGEMAGVDRKLIESGSMTQVKSFGEFKNILLEKKTRKPIGERRKELLDEFIAIICSG